MVVLRDVSELSREAQAGLRRTMEKFVGSCRLILLAPSTGRVIAPLRSRCFHLRVPAPAVADVRAVLLRIADKELGPGRAAPELLDRIAWGCGGNLRRAILALEACRVANPVLEAGQTIPEPEWELYLRETATLMLAEQSPQQLLKVRERLYELLGHCIPAEVVFRGLLRELVPRLESGLRARVTAAAATFEYNLRLGSKPIFHLEAFVAKFMALYKAFTDDVLADFADDSDF